LAFASFIAGFDDPDAYAAHIQNTASRIRPHAGGPYTAQLTQVRLARLNLSMGEENRGRRFSCDVAPGRVYFRLKHADDPPGLRNGQEERPGMVNINRGMARVEDWTPGPTVWRSVSVPLDDLLTEAERLAGPAVGALLGRATCLRPSLQAFARMASLQRGTLRLARDNPRVLEHPQAAAALEARILEALIAMLASAAPPDDGLATRNGQAIVRRVLDHIEAAGPRPIALVELCAAGRCSAKTLETVFRQTIGETPNRYLRRRRLWAAHRMLQDADPALATVTQIATACGFWELGRFAAAYRRLFGQLPSTTLGCGQVTRRTAA
jgi:AraC-like DNA-binding protein